MAIPQRQEKYCTTCYENNGGLFYTVMHCMRYSTTNSYKWVCSFCLAEEEITDIWTINLDRMSERWTASFEEDVIEFIKDFKKHQLYSLAYGTLKLYCPQCYRELITGTFLNRFKCHYCAISGYWNYSWTFEELLELERSTGLKTVQICKTYQGTILELKILAPPKKGWWADNVTPILEFLKKSIPATEREFNPNTQIWSFDAKYWPPIEMIFKGLSWNIQEVATLSGKGNEIPGVNVPKEYAENFHYKSEVVTTVGSAESIAKQLSKFLGVEIIAQDLTDLKKLYRAKALELHPDRGGDAAAMSELNRLWTLYCNTGVTQ